MSEVTFKDGDVVFKSGDVEFDPHEESNLLVVADASNQAVSDAVGLEQEQSISVADCHNDNVSTAPVLKLFGPDVTFADTEDVAFESGDVVFEPHELSGIAILAVSDSFIVNAAESIGLSQESEASVSDAVNYQYAETAALEQEHNLQPSDSYHVNETDVVSLAVVGENTVTAQDGTQVVESDSVALTIESSVTVFKRRRTYYVPQEEKQDEEDPVIVYTLDVSDGMVGSFTDTLSVWQDVNISAINAIVKSSREGASIIKLEQRRRKRFVDEETILLMAA